MLKTQIDFIMSSTRSSFPGSPVEILSMPLYGVVNVNQGIDSFVAG
jgi:hypothetical protein